MSPEAAYKKAGEISTGIYKKRNLVLDGVWKIWKVIEDSAPSRRPGLVSPIFYCFQYLVFRLAVVSEAAILVSF